MNYLNYIAKTNRNNQHPNGIDGTAVLLYHFPKEMKSVLEIGCGTGFTASLICKKYPESNYIGVDINKSMINVAKKQKKNQKLFNCHFITLKDFKYPFNDNQFDLVFCESVLALQNFEGLNLILEEIKRILKPNGIFIFNESYWKKSITDHERKNINKEIFKRFELVQASTFFDFETVSSILENKSLSIVKSISLNDKDEIDSSILQLKLKPNPKKIVRTIFSPFSLFSFLYFKYWNSVYKKNCYLIESYIVICENEKQV